MTDDQLYLEWESSCHLGGGEPLGVAQKDDQVIVSNRLIGNFPGSAIELEFVFTFDGDKIASLEIRS